MIDVNLEQKLNKLFDQDKHEEIVRLIEQIPESERDSAENGWLIRSLNNCEEYERAAEAALRCQTQGENDPSWHRRYGYALYFLGRAAEAEAAFRRATKLGDDSDDTAEWVEQASNRARYIAAKAASEAKRRADKKPRDPSRKPFAGFDFAGFWHNDDYALKTYTGRPATDEMLSAAERDLGYKLPASYKHLVKQQNGGCPANTRFPIDHASDDEPEYADITAIFGVDQAKEPSLTGAAGS